MSSFLYRICSSRLFRTKKDSPGMKWSTSSPRVCFVSIVAAIALGSYDLNRTLAPVTVAWTARFVTELDLEVTAIGVLDLFCSFLSMCLFWCVFVGTCPSCKTKTKTSGVRFIIHLGKEKLISLFFTYLQPSVNHRHTRSQTRFTPSIRLSHTESPATHNLPPTTATLKAWPHPL
jgi:hypothetical protein